MVIKDLHYGTHVKPLKQVSLFCSQLSYLIHGVMYLDGNLKLGHYWNLGNHIMTVVYGGCHGDGCCVDRPPTLPCAGWRHHRMTLTSAVTRRCGISPSSSNRCSSHVAWRHNCVSSVRRGRQGHAVVTSSCRGPIATRCWISTWLEAWTREAESSLLSWNPTPSRTVPGCDEAIRSLLPLRYKIRSSRNKEWTAD